jgi:hypothetical protein
MTLDNLTQFQKIALEGEIAKAISTAKHDPEILYRYYVILKKSPKEIIGFIKEIVRDLVDIDQELLDKVALEAMVDEAPVWLWIDRVIADIKLSITLACADQIGHLSMDKKVMQKKILKSCFIFFCRKCSMLSVSAVRRLCTHIIEEEPIDLDFLEDSCFALLEQLSQLPEDKEINPDLVHCAFDIRDMMSYKVETDVLEKLSNAPLNVEKAEDIANILNDKLEDDNESSDMVHVATIDLSKVNDTSDVSKVISDRIAEILNQQLKSEKATKQEEKWTVYKNYGGYETALRTFDSEKEADDFIDNIVKSFPELKNSCKFNKKKN